MKKSKKVKKVLRGKKAMEAFYKAVGKIGRKEYPLYPFKAGGIENYYLGGHTGVKNFGWFRLTEEQIRYVARFIGMPLSLSKLRAFLATECNVQKPEDYSWPEIIAALDRSITNKMNNMKGLDLFKIFVKAIDDTCQKGQKTVITDNKKDVRIITPMLDRAKLEYRLKELLSLYLTMMCNF